MRPLTGGSAVQEDSGANLRGADLVDAYLFNTNLTEANLSQAKIFGTTFGYIDLRHTKGLDEVDHLGPSSIGIDTIIHSDGKTVKTFLRGAGVPDTFIRCCVTIRSNKRHVLPLSIRQPG